MKAFFDDEGTVDESRNRVRVKSVNKNGLKQVNKMLTRIEIESRITGPNCDSTWYLTINKDYLIKFNKSIGFRHQKRNKKLNNLLKSLQNKDMELNDKQTAFYKLTD
jgi:intein-encoded DNA endonuclease-like protein